MLGVVDTIVLGRLPDVEQLGGAVSAGVIFNSIFWVFGFLRMGTTGLVAQAEGRGDRDESVRTLFQSVALGALIGLALVALQGPIAWIGFAAVGAAERVEELGRSYFHIRIFEAPFFMMTLGITGFLRGKGDAATPMIVMIGMNVVNIIADVLLVPGAFGLPALGVRGAAWASLLSQTLGFIAAAALVWPRVRTHWRWSWLTTITSLPWARFVGVQRDLFVRTALLIISLGAVTSLAARLHDPYELAAHAILLQLWSLVSYGVDGFAYATETTVGQWLGREQVDRAWATGKAALAWGVGLGTAFALAFGAASGWIAAIFTHDLLVQNIVKGMIAIVAIGQPVSAVAYVFDGIMIGATDTRYLRNAMLVSAMAFAAFIAAGWMWRGASLAFIWWSLLFFMAIRTLTLGIRFYSGEWLKSAG